ncbi:hypothetical protein Tco_0394928 [Tanacetum coccineum]
MNTVTTSVNKDNNDDSIKDNTSELVLLGYDGILVKLVNTDAQASAKHSSEVSFRIGIVSIGNSLGPVLYAKLVNGERIRESVNFRTLLALVGSGADVAILLDSVHVVHELFSNSV